jgi:hypothetical protein
MTPKTIIEPQNGWQLIDWRELWRYRDLFTFLVWRNAKTRYALYPGDRMRHHPTAERFSFVNVP